MTEEEKIEGREESTNESGLLLPIETLLSSGIHIGTRIKTKDMISFIYRVRPDGLFVLDVKQTDERIRAAAKFLARFNPSRVIVVSTRLYGITPVKKFCEVTSATPVIGRFLPGIFSNPNHSNHIEADAVVVTDPKADRQAVREAALVGIPVVALCDTDNDFSKVDFIIPANNKGRRSLATIYWLLARQILREKGEVAPDGDLSTPIDAFETKLVESPSMMD
jgi:small subunit ribosomal protein S2